MNRPKLRKILQVLSADETKVDFSQFDNEVAKLKQKLTEQITVKTLEDVNVALEKNRKRLNFEPLTQAFDELKQSVEAKNTELLSSLNSKQEELKKLVIENDKENQDKIEGLITEIAILSARKAPDFTNQIKDTETKLTQMIESAKAADNAEDEQEKQQLQAQFAAFEKQVKDLRLQTQSRGGSMNRKISVGGTVISTKYTDVNFIAGSNVTVAAVDNTATKQVDITITSTGGTGGYTVETPTGTVDGANVTFTVTATPVYIVSDGTTYFLNQGYTAVGLTITMSVPPTNFIRSFHV